MRNLHQEVTDRIVAELEAGAPPWVQPWSQTPGLNRPCNAVTGRPYSGVNVLLLWLARSNGWPTPRFLTFNQACDAGGHVRKGEHGMPVYFVGDTRLKKPEASDEDDERRVRFLKRYTVFNIAQCEELPDRITRPPQPQHHDLRDLTVDEFITTLGADICEADGIPAYIPAGDYIRMPPFAAFKSAVCYYETLFHETIHWTGHRSRLDRDLAKRFDRPHQRYAAE